MGIRLPKNLRNYSSMNELANNMRLGKRVGLPSVYGQLYEHPGGIVKLFRNNKNSVKREIQVATKLSGIGPDIHFAISNGGTGIMWMEDLRTGPGVLNSYTVAEAKNRYVPTEDIRRLFTKLHRMGIVHGNAHTGNIFIQKVRMQNGSIKYMVRPIDFGMAINTGRELTNTNANKEVVKQGSPNIYEHGGMFHSVYGRRLKNSRHMRLLRRNVLASHPLEPNRKPKTRRNLLSRSRK